LNDVLSSSKPARWAFCVLAVSLADLFCSREYRLKGESEVKLEKFFGQLQQMNDRKL